MAIPGLKTPEEIAAEIWGLNPEKLFQRTRKREVVEARQVLMVYRHVELGQTQAIAAEFYGMDHASVDHARKTVYSLLVTNRAFREKHERFFKCLA